MNQLIELISSQGSIRIPIETVSEFQRAFSASFGTLPLATAAAARRGGDEDDPIHAFDPPKAGHRLLDAPGKPGKVHGVDAGVAAGHAGVGGRAKLDAIAVA